MPSTNRRMRLLTLAVVTLLLAAVLWMLLGALRSAVALWHELSDLPTWLSVGLGVLLAAVAGGGIWRGWRVLHPRAREHKPVSAPTRPEIDERITRLEQQRADTSQLEAELRELDKRRHEGDVYVAVFGEISAGKSSVIRALAPGAHAQVDVLGGTTRAVEHYRSTLKNGREVVLSDVPGTREADAAAREALARDEALRAHLVLYICAGDLTREQDAELRWLDGFGKPLILALNKIDQLGERDASLLDSALRTRYRDVVDAQVLVSAGGREQIETVHADGSRESHLRSRPVQIDALLAAITRLSAHGAEALEPARETAVLGSLSQRAGELETSTRAIQAQMLITRYTRRAIVGAMAAVAPGSDLVIQGALATALIRELARTYDVAIREIDIDVFLKQASLSLRASTAIVLAIAGNALKAFPGLGTLGGGVVHAIAYGLIFDSLGRAVATTLAEQQQFDQAHASATLKKLLAQTSSERMREIAALALSARKDEHQE